MHMGWLRSVGLIKLQVSFAEYRLFCRALLQKRPIILSILLTVATLYVRILKYSYVLRVMCLWLESHHAFACKAKVTLHVSRCTHMPGTHYTQHLCMCTHHVIRMHAFGFKAKITLRVYRCRVQHTGYIYIYINIYTYIHILCNNLCMFNFK